MKYFGRRKPYTATGIRRVPCARCGEPSSVSWQSCANGRWYVAICTACDLAINAMVLAFFNIPNRCELMAAYRRGKLAP